MITTELLVVGAGPYALSTAGLARERGIKTVVVGRPMEFWRENMPEGMFLRSGPDWHMDGAGTHTMAAFLEDRVAIAYLGVVALGETRLRLFGARALESAALRAAGWRGRTLAFPGLEAPAPSQPALRAPTPGPSTPGPSSPGPVSQSPPPTGPAGA